MFDIDAGKFIIVGVIALVFIPPKDLPRVMRQVGQFVGKMRRMASEFQGQFMDAMREADMADLRKEAQKLSDAARASTGIDTLHDLNHHMTSTLAHDPGDAPRDAEQGGGAEPTASPSEGSSLGQAEHLAEAARVSLPHTSVDSAAEKAPEARAAADQPV